MQTKLVLELKIEYSLNIYN